FASIALVVITCSALRRARQLQRSEERYRTLYTQTPVPMHTLDSEAKVMSVSEHWLELLGYGRREVIGRPIAAFQRLRSAEDFRASLWPRILAGDAIGDVEHEFVRKNGEVVVVLVSARAE